MLYIYRRAPSTGARELAEHLGACRYRGVGTPINRRARRGDSIVCWGEHLEPIEGVKFLNNVPIRSKYEDAVKLKEQRVPTVDVSRTRPVAGPATPPTDPATKLWKDLLDMVEDLPAAESFRRGDVLNRAVADLHNLVTNLTATLRTPLPPAVAREIGEWLARRNNHVGGNDLLTPTHNPEYFSKKESLIREFRVHSFKGRSLRAGVKAVRDGYAIAYGAPPAGTRQAHDWIRSWDGGWRIRYDGVTSQQRHRDLAHSAVAALDLDFGAVDIGEKTDGSLLVLEVNRAPGLEGGTVDAYSTAIERWSNGQ